MTHLSGTYSHKISINILDHFSLRIICFWLYWQFKFTLQLETDTICKIKHLFLIDSLWYMTCKICQVYLVPVFNDHYIILSVQKSISSGLQEVHSTIANSVALTLQSVNNEFKWGEIFSRKTTFPLVQFNYLLS